MARRFVVVVLPEDGGGYKHYAGASLVVAPCYVVAYAGESLFVQCLGDVDEVIPGGGRRMC